MSEIKTSSPPDNEFAPDWACLSELRARFLDTNSPSAKQNRDYWLSLHHLEQYDQTFARRIAWKWQSIVSEVQDHLEKLLPSLESVCDLGCGSGVAGEILCSMLPGLQTKKWQLTDRSARARAYARNKMSTLFKMQVSEASDVKSLRPDKNMFYVASHMLTELDQDSLPYLVDLLRNSDGFLFVEPGTKHASRRLIELREQMRVSFEVIGPCFHQKTCPLWTEDVLNTPADWCHQTLHPPSEVFQSRFWKEFSVKLGIDLRSLSSSWLFMIKKPDMPLQITEQADLVRLLGRPQILKASVEMKVCAGDGNLKDYRIQKRDHAQLYKLFKKGRMDSYLNLDQG